MVLPGTHRRSRIMLTRVSSKPGGILLRRPAGVASTVHGLPLIAGREDQSAGRRFGCPWRRRPTSGSSPSWMYQCCAGSSNGELRIGFSIFALTRPIACASLKAFDDQQFVAPVVDHLDRDLAVLAGFERCAVVPAR